MIEAEPIVIVVDDDASVRASLDSLFRSVGLVTSLHAGAAEALAAGFPDTPACIVSDVRMPGVGGLEFQAALTSRGEVVPIVFMTGHGDIPMTVQAMKGGAVDFLAKPFREQDMLDAVSAALERSRRSLAAGSGFSQLRERHAALTPREREVMGGVVRGLLNKQVAAQLGIAEITVKLHRASVMRKLGLRSLPELVRFADALAAERGGTQTTV